MIPLLLSLVVGASLLQPSSARLLGASVASLSTLCHHMFLSGTDGLLYFGSAAAMDSAALYVISTVRPITRLALRLQYVCLASILCNAMGWVMWMLYQPATLYVTTYAVLYAWLLVVLLVGGPIERVGGSTVRIRRPHLYKCIGAGGFLDFTDSGKV